MIFIMWVVVHYVGYILSAFHCTSQTFMVQISPPLSQSLFRKTFKQKMGSRIKTHQGTLEMDVDHRKSVIEVPFTSTHTQSIIIMQINSIFLTFRMSWEHFEKILHILNSFHGFGKWNNHFIIIPLFFTHCLTQSFRVLVQLRQVQSRKY